MAQKANTMFGLRKKQPEPFTGFRSWLENEPKYFWVVGYIDNQNEIREQEAFDDMQEGNDTRIGHYTMPKFKKLVAKLYAEYLQVNEDLTDDSLEILLAVQHMPINITIRRIKPKASGNKWSAQYLNRTVYYGKTLNEAIRKLKERNPNVAAKFAGPEA